MCSVLSNHQAPSRDIALKCADLDRVKHILSGGYWVQDSQWIQAGKSVHGLLRRTPILQRHLGWSPEPVWIPGAIKCPTATKQKALSSAETFAISGRNPLSVDLKPDTEWTLGQRVTAVSGDQCRVGSWGVFRVGEVCVFSVALEKRLTLMIRMHLFLEGFQRSYTPKETNHHKA